MIAINELEKLVNSKYDEDYPELLSMDGLYMVKWLTCNIDEIISNEKLAKEVLELLDSVMDDMSSGVLNGLTPNEYWEQQE